LFRFPFRDLRSLSVCLSVLLGAVAAPSLAAAQDPPLAITADFLFYGDNTEFANEFRRGETLLGNSGRVVLSAGIGNRATLVGGVLGDRRFGGDRFNLVRPVFALNFDAGHSHFTFGTLHLTGQPTFGPDRGGPHGLLPPIQRDTMLLTRPYEAGLQWTHKTSRLQHEFWVDWQRLNTHVGREVFDSGAVGRVDLNRAVAIAYQSHVVHHGGQLYSTGVVSDSWVAAPGVVLTRTMDGRTAILESYGLLSRHVPDREHLDRATTGAALFTRASVEQGPWRAHLIVWRGNDYIKEEGDPNYGGLRRDGSRFRKVRDYAELGITRVGNPVPELQLEGSARLHRVESHYEYSYRILGRVTLRWPL
jgi:hypothetical protein